MKGKKTTSVRRARHKNSDTQRRKKHLSCYIFCKMKAKSVYSFIDATAWSAAIISLCIYLITNKQFTTDVAKAIGKRRDKDILIKHTVLFSTVLKPTSEILGSFSPRSKAHKTLVASENIPRSVRTRTCHEVEKKHTHWHFFLKKLAKYRKCRRGKMGHFAFKLTSFLVSPLKFSHLPIVEGHVTRALRSTGIVWSTEEPLNEGKTTQYYLDNCWTIQDAEKE